MVDEIGVGYNVIKQKDSAATLLKCYLMYFICSLNYEKVKDQYPDDEWTYFYRRQALYYKKRFFDYFEN